MLYQYASELSVHELMQVQVMASTGHSLGKFELVRIHRCNECGKFIARFNGVTALAYVCACDIAGITVKSAAGINEQTI